MSWGSLWSLLWGSLQWLSHTWPWLCHTGELGGPAAAEWSRLYSAQVEIVGFVQVLPKLRHNGIPHSSPLLRQLP